MHEPQEATETSYAFVLKLTDQPGGMELIAATFANRGVSLTCSLGNDGTLDPEGRATVIVTFSAAPSKKEALRRALGRLARVRSLVEHPLNSPGLRKTAVLRVADAARETLGPWAERLETVGRDEAAGDATYVLVDRPPVVDNLLARLRAAGALRAVTTTIIGL